MFAIKNYAKNVNLSIGEVSEFYNGTSFVHVVNVIDCGKSEFQVGIMDVILGGNRTAQAVLSDVWHATKSSNAAALIAIKPAVVCTECKKAQCSG